MNDDCKATRELRVEHQWILQVAEVLETLVERAGSGDGAPDFEAFDDCIRFFRLFADACHHAKEEDMLFSELEGAGMSREVGPIAVMLYEHGMARAHVASMAGAIVGARAGDSSELRRLMEAAHDYIDVIRAHILKEDNVLFNMADGMLEGAACARLCDGFEGLCDHVFEGCTKAQLQDLARTLMDRYAA